MFKYIGSHSIFCLLFILKKKNILKNHTRIKIKGTENLSLIILGTNMRLVHFFPNYKISLNLVTLQAYEIGTIFPKWQNFSQSGHTASVYLHVIGTIFPQMAKFLVTPQAYVYLHVIGTIFPQRTKFLQIRSHRSLATKNLSGHVMRG
jgi:hypothetical protein